MRTLKFLPLVILIIASSCGSNEDDTVYDEKMLDPVVKVDYETYKQEMADLDSKLMVNPEDEVLMEEAMTKFQDYAGFFPEDSLSPTYLKKASDLSHRTGRPEKAIKILDRIINEYPGYFDMMNVKYTRCTYLDWDLRDTARAKQAWTEFKNEYPGTNFALDAAYRIKYIQYDINEYTDMMANGKIEPIEPEVQ
ncbi:tetratricopeptide repeat protein [Paracrocinitomix mangrovi]|uniref:tetratricopeptide repeat protein n=1 Tax=Paracrocinitomix mangrovi TaxID=2862509 RepID=UPI001C8DC64A|nr:tetratricopeptide repeat protein [Paracrocinitomix mangrovi]UKN01379.1 tetratricopeptide repeat protein [Paracrocinitomix mangrovi]